MTFPSALRAVLRGDPDIVALGELRDTETAATVLKAALTGCFVLSTIHARDAAGTITRLLEMDVQSYVVAATVAAVVAQRLARRLCIHCRIPYTAGSEAAEFGLPPETVLFEAHGCSACDKGYLGLVGIHQLLVVTDDIQRLILARAPYEDVFAAARAEGMRTLWEDGLAKAVDGVTTIHALRRAIGDV